MLTFAGEKGRFLPTKPAFAPEIVA